MFIQVGNDLINLNFVTYVDLNWRPTAFHLNSGVRIELVVSDGQYNKSSLEYFDDRAEALRNYFTSSKFYSKCAYKVY